MQSCLGQYRHICCALTALALGGVLLATGTATAQSPCTCRAAGVSYDLDACTCLNTPAGPRRACCGKVLNNTAWRFTEASCPTAHLPVTGPPRAFSKPTLPKQTPWLAAARD